MCERRRFTAAMVACVGLVALAVAGNVLPGCGRARTLETGEELEPVVLGGGGATRTSRVAVVVVTTPAPVVRTPRAQPTPIPEVIYPYTFVVPATEGIPNWNLSDFPFNVATIPFVPAVPPMGWTTQDRQTPFHFSFTMPGGTFQFHNARLVIDTSRDTSDTEGIFVDGVFSGRPPWNFVNTVSPKVTDALYLAVDGAGTQGPGTNTYYIDWSFSHYMQNKRNTFDLDLADLLRGSSKTAAQALSDGVVPVVTGDDSPIYQASLVVNGYVVSKVPLDCSDSPPYTFVSDIVHNDGNSVGEAAFSGSRGHPFEIYATPTNYAFTEFFFDPRFPQVGVDRVSLASASLYFPRVKRVAGASAIVVNGIGIAETGFDRGSATSVVERWDDSVTAQGGWTSFLATIPATGIQVNAIELNLANLFDVGTLKQIVAQGKLNVAMAGGLKGIYAAGASSGRAFRVAVAGPEFRMNGTYTSPECTVPPQPADPTPLPDEEMDEGEATETVLDDGAGPAISSVQVMEVTSNSARILWQTDEASTSQVAYGIGGLTAATAVDATRVRTHELRITGLSSYKYYSFQVISKDEYGNESRSDVRVFTTLR